MIKSTKDAQAALKNAGCDPGPIDGVLGRGSIAAAKKFQTAHGLTPDGVIGPKTLAALFPPAPGEKTTSPATAAPTMLPPWYTLAEHKMGLQENLNNKELRAFLASDGHALGDPSVLPWCGDFVETCIALSLPGEKIPTNPYWAQNWVNFGRSIDHGAPGAVMAFGRTGGGHVAFYVGEDADYYTILGGNQSNAVTKMRIAKNRLMPHGIRWPTTYPLPTAGKVAATGAAISKNEA